MSYDDNDNDWRTLLLTTAEHQTIRRQLEMPTEPEPGCHVVNRRQEGRGRQSLVLAWLAYVMYVPH